MILPTGWQLLAAVRRTKTRQIGQCRHSLFHSRADGQCRHSRLFHSRADRTVPSQSVSLSLRSDSAITVVCFTLVQIGQCRHSRLFHSRADRTTGLCGRSPERQHRLAGAFAAQIPSSGYGNQCRIQSTHSGYFGQSLSQSMYV